MAIETINIAEEETVSGATPWGHALATELRELKEPPRTTHRSAGVGFEVHATAHAFWIVTCWPSGGRTAFCAAYIPSGEYRISGYKEKGAAVECQIRSPLGTYRITIEFPHGARRHLHWNTALTPAEDITIPYWPRDIYMLDGAGALLNTRGMIHACQRGPKAGLLYTSFTRPESGTFLYLQNFTALNEFFEATHASPSDTVGGTWPELGFSLPSTREGVLKGGKETTIADAFIIFSEEIPTSDRESARLFMELYATLYLALPKPTAIHRHWPRRVRETIRDLTHSPECSVELAGERYLQAYIGSTDRPPESMVQLAVLVPMLEYQKWSGETIPLARTLLAGLPGFYDPKIGTVVRWHPALPYEKQKEMDSWYLYHTYLNLSRLALWGNSVAKRLFLDSVEYGIKVARTFDYRWPVFYDPATLEVRRAESKPGHGGENDVGGLYAHVMLQAYELTGDRKYLEEAECAARKLLGLGFRLAYQFNNTAFGAGALLRLWRLTGDEVYRELSLVGLANIFHNLWLWECDYGYARHYHTFMGMPPLHDGCYLAMYEELEVMAAFHEYLEIGGEDIPPSARLILAEYCKYLIDRGWFHYPSELPADILEEKQESGRLNRTLSIPLEDLYDGWQKAGKVGQEIYGAAAPFVIATRHCHRIPGTEFMLHCNYPTADVKVEPAAKGRGKARLRAIGDGRCSCEIRLVSEGSQPLPSATLRIRKDGAWRNVEGVFTQEGYLEFTVPGDAQVMVEWEIPRPASRARKGTKRSAGSPAKQQVHTEGGRRGKKPKVKPSEPSERTETNK